MNHIFPPSEDFLQYVWYRMYVQWNELLTSENQKLIVLNSGKWNKDQGPDFLDACIQLDGIRLYGHVEIHLHSQDWYRHGHQHDPLYNACMLHVVYEGNGVLAMRQDGSLLPELQLKGLVDVTLWQKYDRLRLSENQIACHFYVRDLDEKMKKSYLEDLGEERIQDKVEAFRLELQHTGQDWAETLWRGLAGFMGGSVNKAAFSFISEQLPLSHLRLYQHQSHRLEALIFGVSGLLEGPMQDSYHKSLQQEWFFLQHKHRLPDPYPLPLKFLRMHPAAFPTIRLSQLAQILLAVSRLEDLLDPSYWPVLMRKEIKASTYWESHHRFGEALPTCKPKRLGKQQKEAILLNVLLPLSILYMQEHGRQGVWERVIKELDKLPPESNRYTRAWADMGFPNEKLLHSQGILKLAREYCLEKRCLECRIGQQIVGPS